MKNFKNEKIWKISKMKMKNFKNENEKIWKISKMKMKKYEKFQKWKWKNMKNCKNEN